MHCARDGNGKVEPERAPLPRGRVECVPEYGRREVDEEELAVESVQPGVMGSPPVAGTSRPMVSRSRRTNISTETVSSACAKAGFDANHLRADSAETGAILEPDRSESMTDQYYSAIQEQWSNIRGLYLAYSSKKPIMLYDIHEKKIYAYPYKEFKAELSERSQVSLEIDYKSTSVRGGMIVFVRDDIERKLVSYVMNIDAATIQ
jgi:hypothetical protein